jgi:biotin carboxyl carrier protein
MSPTRPNVTFTLLLFSTGFLAAVSRAAPPGEVKQAETLAFDSAEKGPRLVRVPAPRDGIVTHLATEVAAGEKVPPARLVEVSLAYLIVRVGEKEKVSPDQLIDLGREGRWRLLRDGEAPEPGRVRVYLLKKEFKRLGPGDVVEAGKTVALLDPVIAIKELRDGAEALEKAESERKIAAKTREEADRRVAAIEATLRQRRVPGSVSKDDCEGAKLTARRCLEEEVAKEAAVAKARKDLARAGTAVRQHEVRTPVAGVIRSVEKQPGQAVKPSETILTVETPRRE